ncbi:tyrosine-type recombinase/integrase [Isoptericola sp. NPDC056578]|uniref:tyrosine-type recombinase/integrase n=1 Tax=Isoptericola sp. NPDC056578 TaxID=3345870 RepID=UPI0036A017AF
MASISKDTRGTRPRWVVNFKTAAGAGRRRSFPTMTQAEAYKRQVESGTAGHDDGKKTVREFVADRIAFRYSDPAQLATRQQVEQRMRSHVSPVLGDVRLDRLDAETVEAWALSLKAKGLAASTVRLIASNLRSLLADAVGPARPLTHNPVNLASVRAKIADDFADRPEWESDDDSEVTFWQEDRVAAVLAALRPDLRLMGEVCAGLGVRQGELLALAVEDFNFAAKAVTVRAQVKVLDGNTLVFADLKHRANRKKRQDRTRTVPLPDDLARLVREHVARGRATEVTMPWAHPDGRAVTRRLLFVTRESKAWNRNYLNRHWRAALRAVGVPVERRNGMHALRHHYASVLIDAGIPITAVAEYLGHASAEFTLRVYGHALRGADDRALTAVNAALARRSGYTTGTQTTLDNVVDLRRHA